MLPRFRVVVDTNAWISSFLNPLSLVGERLARLRADANIRLLLSADLRNEILDVVQRPKFKKYISDDDLQAYLRRINSYKLTPVAVQVEICRDPKDNFLLALCLDGRADFLITGDQDLLVLKQFQQTRIISWAEAEAGPGLLTT